MNKQELLSKIRYESQMIEYDRHEKKDLESKLEESMQVSIYVWSLVNDRIKILDAEIQKRTLVLASLYLKLGNMANNRDKRRSNVIDGMYGKQNLEVV